MKNLTADLPMGFSMALAKNPNALERFAEMNDEEKSAVLSGVKNVKSKQEMQQYVENLLR